MSTSVAEYVTSTVLTDNAALSNKSQTTIEPQQTVGNVESSMQNWKTVNHLHNYPLVQQMTQAVNYFPTSRIVISASKPACATISDFQVSHVFPPITGFVDSAANQGMNLIDKVVPSLKTKTFQRLGEEFMAPCAVTKRLVSKAGHGVVDAAETWVYDPTHLAILKFRKFYNKKIYDTKGKPLIRGTFDPVVSPLNDKLEGMLSAYGISDTENGVPTDGFSNEIDRTVALLIDAVQKTVPAAAGTVESAVYAPIRYTFHVCDVINENLDRQENITMCSGVTAHVNATKSLTTEAINKVQETLPVFPKLPTLPGMPQLPKIPGLPSFKCPFGGSCSNEVVIDGVDPQETQPTNEGMEMGNLSVSTVMDTTVQ